jgi:DNA-binding IclR family transcriptional regulator
VRGTHSAPTARVCDVIELLSRPGHAPFRFSDVVRELDLTQATAHAILKTLADRGWVSRDPVAKTFALGPTLALVSGQLDATRPLAQIARQAAHRLAETIGMAASVVERAGDSLVITAFEGPDGSLAASMPDQRIPYSPPFGVGFAAWDTLDGQQAWVDRAAAADPDLRRRLHDVLAHTRERGYDVDWMTPTLASAAQAIGTLTDDLLPHHLRPVIDQLLVEFTAAGLAPDDDSRRARPIATISAPVLDSAQRIQLVLAIHPLRPLSVRAIQTAARPLLREIRRVTEEFAQ